MEPCNQNHRCERKQRGWVHVGRNPCNCHHDLGGQLLEKHITSSKEDWLCQGSRNANQRGKAGSPVNQPELWWQQEKDSSSQVETWPGKWVSSSRGQTDAAGNPGAWLEGDTQILPLLLEQIRELTSISPTACDTGCATGLHKRLLRALPCEESAAQPLDKGFCKFNYKLCLWSWQRQEEEEVSAVCCYSSWQPAPSVTQSEALGPEQGPLKALARWDQGQDFELDRAWGRWGIWASLRRQKPIPASGLPELSWIPGKVTSWSTLRFPICALEEVHRHHFWPRTSCQGRV